jgi:hypothetical protein
VIGEALWHLGARAASAGLSFVLFAAMARARPAEEAKAVLFFTFVTGFYVAAARSFGSMYCRLEGTEGRVSKLRSVRNMARWLFWIGAATAVAAGVTVRASGLPWGVAAATVVVVGLASLDSDLARAALNLRTTFSAWFALGSALAIAAYLAAGRRSVPLDCLVLLLQWCPLAIVNLYLWSRLWPSRRALQVGFERSAPGGTFSALLVSFLDGLILNTPFIVGSQLSADSGVRTAVATRLFVSSLALLPLVMHWSNSGTLAVIARRANASRRSAFAGVLLGSGAAGIVALGVVYGVVSGSSVEVAQYAVAFMLLGSFAYYSARVRFRPIDERSARRMVLQAAVLGGYWIAYGALASRGALTAVAVAVLQSLALLAAGFVSGHASNERAAGDGALSSLSGMEGER